MENNGNVPVIQLDNLRIEFGKRRILNDLNGAVSGRCIGLLGPNGAGKSTLLKSLLGLVLVDGGSIKVLDREIARDPFGVRSRIGYMPEGDSVMPELNALEYATLAAELCGLPRAEATGRAHQVLHYVGLGEARYRKLGSFSTGMKQRARLAQALVGSPELLLLDEPTSGLDPRGRDEMLALILDIPVRTGASVILSTHILPDVEKTCDQVVVVAQGEVLYAGELAPLIAPEAGMFELRVKGDPAAVRMPLELAGCKVIDRGTTLEVRVPSGEGASFILRVATEAGQQVRHVAPYVQTLERAFFKTLASAGKAAD